MTDHWQVLDLEPTDDLRAIKSAYAKLVKSFRPEENPHEFKKIREAYENILAQLKNQTHSSAMSSQQAIASSGRDDDEDKEDEPVFKALDSIMSVYENLESRNNLSVWQSALNENSLVLSINNNAGYSFFREIIKQEYLYKSELKLSVNVYILLIDFFHLDANTYFSETYNTSISEALLSEIAARRFSLRELAIPACEFNEYICTNQVIAELFLQELLKYSGAELVERSENISAKIRAASDNQERTIMSRVVFKYILDSFLRPDRDPDVYLAGLMNQLLKFQKRRRSFIGVFKNLGYHKQDIINCLAFCEKSYKTEIYSRVQTYTWYSTVILIALLFVLIMYLRAIK